MIGNIYSDIIRDIVESLHKPLSINIYVKGTSSKQAIMLSIISCTFFYLAMNWMWQLGRMW